MKISDPDLGARIEATFREDQEAALRAPAVVVLALKTDVEAFAYFFRGLFDGLFAPYLVGFLDRGRE